jgi:ankyrin repeat protein
MPRAWPPPPSLAPRVGFKADVNICSVDGRWPVYAAAAAGRALMASNLVAHAAHVNICDRSGVSISPALAAAFSKNLERVKLRVVAGASSNSLSVVALHEACEIRDRQAVEAPFADGADINQCNRTGESPFQVAVEQRLWLGLRSGWVHHCKLCGRDIRPACALRHSAASD